MSEYINKSALVAEIERRIDELCNYPATEPEQILSKAASLKPLMELRLFLDTLEVKEVDLEKEVDKWYNNKAPKEFENILYRDIENCAKYFFELGLKAQKRE